MWTTRSIPRPSCSRIASCGSPRPAISASVSSRRRASSGELACTVESAPSWPVLSATSRSSASAPRTSPITIRSGRIRSALRSRSRIVTSPRPSTDAGRASSRTTCGWRSRSSAASSIVITRSSSTDVGRERVQQRRLPRAGAAADDDAASLRPRRAASTSSGLRREGARARPAARRSAARRRSAGSRAPARRPRAAGSRRSRATRRRGGRRPSGSARRRGARAGRGCARSRRAAPARTGSVTSVRSIRPAPLDVDAVRRVDQHVLDGGVGEQLLQRAEPDGVAQDQLAELAAKLRREHGRLGGDQLARPPSARSPAGGLPGGRVGPPPLAEARAQLGRQRLDVSLSVSSRPRGGATPPVLSPRAKLARVAAVEVLEGDITKLEVDAIANAANTDLRHGGGVAGAIVARRGAPIQAESDERRADRARRGGGDRGRRAARASG